MCGGCTCTCVEGVHVRVWRVYMYVCRGCTCTCVEGVHVRV